MDEGGLEKKKIRQDQVAFTRHSNAGYRTYEKILGSDDPLAHLNPEDQVTPDLSEKGVELAQAEAGKFFSTLDPETDELFFVSSGQARALETATIYKDVAKTKGFDVLAPTNTRSELAKTIGGGDIRVLRDLSLNNKVIMAESVFNPDRTMPPINWDAATRQDPGLKERWERARAIVQSHDYGSWGANMFHHAKAVKEILPEVETAEDRYDRQFKHLLRLAEFGMEKAQTAGREKYLKVLAFGHEDYIGHALNQYFQEHEIKNCETIVFRPDESGNLTLERRGERVML